MTSTAMATSPAAGRAAIASGVIGILTLGLLFTGVGYMLGALPGHSAVAVLMYQAHGAGIALQSLCLVPVAIALDTLARPPAPGQGRASLFAGLTALSLMALLASLWIVNVVADNLYTIPQGLLGVWLMVMNRRLTGVLPRGLTRLGIVVGFGLLLVGTFPIAYAIFVDPIALRGPVPPDYPNPDTFANAAIHNVFFLGSLLGVDPFPIWTILVGRQLLRARTG